jgi:hypothetical protein
MKKEIRGRLDEALNELGQFCAEMQTVFRLPEWRRPVTRPYKDFSGAARIQGWCAFTDRAAGFAMTMCVRSWIHLRLSGLVCNPPFGEGRGRQNGPQVPRHGSGLCWCHLPN